MKIISMLAVLTASFATQSFSDPLAVHDTATRIFDRLPAVKVSDDLFEACGFGTNSNDHIGYCATKNTIFISEGFVTRPEASYEMAHVLGHAIQVRHGVADVALREIRNRRDEETQLRGMVTRQVECVAGVLTARAGLAAFDLASLGAEPFTDSHWGRAPINSGPRVSIGLAARAQWYANGYATGDFASCSVGDMSSQLIVDAQR